MPLYDWNTIDREQMNPTVARQVLHTERMTVALIHLAQGATVPEHAHDNEQVSLVQKGRLRFTIAGEEQIAVPGQAVHLPPNVPHKVEALEDSLAVDIFTPRREDWIRGDDAYLRN